VVRAKPTRRKLAPKKAETPPMSAIVTIRKRGGRRSRPDAGGAPGGAAMPPSHCSAR
jgi:hypothetical protein